MEITKENYYSDEIAKEYMSFHRWLSLHGSLGLIPCEARAMAELNGEWKDEFADDKALMIGSYVDSALVGDEGELEQFKAEHPEIFVSRGANVGALKAEYQLADRMIERCERDIKFMAYLSGEHQKIFTCEMWGVKWCCRLDNYHKGGWISDLKTTKSISQQFWAGADTGHVSFVEFYGYDYQLALYQEIVYQCTGERLPCFICAVSKEKHPRIEVIQIPDSALFDALSEIKKSVEYTPLPQVWKGTVRPTRCDRDSCEYCADTKQIMQPIDYRDICTNF